MILGTSVFLERWAAGIVEEMLPAPALDRQWVVHAGCFLAIQWVSMVFEADLAVEPELRPGRVWASHHTE